MGSALELIIGQSPEFTGFKFDTMGVCKMIQDLKSNVVTGVYIIWTNIPKANNQILF